MVDVEPQPGTDPTPEPTMFWHNVEGDHRVYLFTEQEAKWWAVSTPRERARIIECKRAAREFVQPRSK